MKPLKDQIEDVLLFAWRGALDASSSNDFRNPDGSLNEDDYLKYQEKVVAEGTYKIAIAIEALLPEEREMPSFKKDDVSSLRMFKETQVSTWNECLVEIRDRIRGKE